MIYAVLSRLNRCTSFSSYLAIMVEGRQKKERSQKIDDLPVLATCWCFSDLCFPGKRVPPNTFH